MRDWTPVSDAITRATGVRFECARSSAVAGGDINSAYRLEGSDGRRYFVKLNAAGKHAMFAAERAGLAEMAGTETVRVPRPVAEGVAGPLAFLVLEYLELGGRGNGRQLGEQLAALHRTTAPQFGFAIDNTIGSTPQPNGWMTDWIAFLRQRRLGFQLQLAESSGYRGKLQERGAVLLEALPAFFSGYAPTPSLLHGDLWGGNHAYLKDGTPVIFDPAPYYGDREVDLAMTELFGGFDPDFYSGYRAGFALDPGYPVRKTLYNLYHILNHANLFGGGYARQAEGMIDRLLAAIR
ncbi:MAG TPA: fructosamine kinase family protein [Gallionellaceae bacterium]|nr:fructosamine kinase family protein [Gallionellaceae bacterium]